MNRWKNFDYLEEIFGGPDALYRSEYSDNNHFMYWQHTGAAALGAGIANLRSWETKQSKEEEGQEEEEEGKWTNPTEGIYLTFREWVQFAIENDPSSVPSSSTSVPSPKSAAGYKYFRVSGYDNGTSPLFAELPFFQNKQSFFIVTPEDQEGIHCRFCEF